MDQAYDVNQIFGEMERELFESYQRNMARHLQDEIDEGFSWTMWQAQKLADLKQYKQEARRIVDKKTKQAKDAASGQIVDSYAAGAAAADAILRNIIHKGDLKVDSDGFGRANRRKMDALLDAVNNDFDTAGAAALRMVDDEYRKIIFKSQVQFSSGSKTLSQAIDTAAADFLRNGINAIVYKNGARVNIASYAEMALRASNKKAYMTGEGAKQQEWGVELSQVTSYGMCSPTCLPWQGKVYVNDVYAGGKPDGVHTLLSTAMSEGLFHPNCRHTAQPYFDGISINDKAGYNQQEVLEKYEQEQRQRAIERKIREWKRVSIGSVDPVNREKADNKVRHWQAEMRDHLKKNPYLRRKSDREQVKGRRA